MGSGAACAIRSGGANEYAIIELPGARFSYHARIRRGSAGWRLDHHGLPQPQQQYTSWKHENSIVWTKSMESYGNGSDCHVATFDFNAQFCKFMDGIGFSVDRNGRGWYIWGCDE